MIRWVAGSKNKYGKRFFCQIHLYKSNKICIRLCKFNKHDFQQEIIPLTHSSPHYDILEEQLEGNRDYARWSQEGTSLIETTIMERSKAQRWIERKLFKGVEVRINISNTNVLFMSLPNKHSHFS